MGSNSASVRHLFLIYCGHSPDAIPINSYSPRSTMPSLTRSQAVARIADRTAKNCEGHVT